MIDRITVTDYARSNGFHEEPLAHLGLKLVTEDGSHAGFGLQS